MKALSLFNKSSTHCRKQILRFAGIIVLLTFALQSFGATYYSRVATGNFATAATWGTDRAGATPATTLVAGDIFIIETGNNITFGASQTAAGVTVESGGTLTCGGTFTLTSPLTIDLGGTLTITTTRLTMAGNTINNGTISLTTGRFIRTTSTLTNSGSITMGAGLFTATTGGFTNEATGTLTVTGALATLTLGTGDFVNNNNTSGSVNFGSSAVALTGTAQSIGSFTTTGAVTASNASGTITVTGNINGASFTKSGAGTINMGSGTHTFTGVFALGTTVGSIVNGGSSTINVNVTSTGAWTGTGTLFTPGTSTVNFGSAGAQTITATVPTFYNLTFSNAGTKTIPAGTTLSVSNNWIVNSPATLATTGSANVIGDISGSGAITMGSGTIFLEGSWTNSGTLTPGTGTVNYDASGNQTIAALTYAKLQTATGGIKTLAGNATANNLVTIGASTTLNLDAFTLSLTFTGAPLVNNGTISGSGEVNYSGANQTVAGTTYTNLELSGSGTKTVLAGNTVITSGNLIITSTTSFATTAAAVIGGGISGAGSLTAGSGTISIAGDWTKTGTFAPGTGIVLYNGTNQLIGVANYYKLQISNAGTKTLAGNISPANTVTVDSPSILNLDTYTLTLPVTGSALIISGTLSGTGTVLYSGGAAQTIAPATYYDLSFSGLGTKTIADATSVTITNNWVIGSTTSMDLTGSAVVTGDVSGTGALTMGSGTISLGGSWLKTGTFTAGTGTFNYNGTTQTIATLNYYKLQTSSSGIKTLAANTIVSNVLTINSPSSIDLSTFTLTLSGAGTPLVSNGTFTPSTSTVIFNNAASTNIPAVNFFNLNGTGGPRVLANSGVIGIAGTFTKGAGAYTVTGSTVNFNGAAQTIPAFTFNDLILSGSLAKTILTATVVNVNTIEIQDGPTLDLPGTAQLNITKP